MKGGTIVDATIINAPSSTKNVEKARDPEVHQTKKGNEWKFGMKCHSGVDAGSGLVHTMTVTAANEHDITQTANLLREDDGVVYGDSGYLGVLTLPARSLAERSDVLQHTCFATGNSANATAGVVSGWGIVEPEIDNSSRSQR